MFPIRDCNFPNTGAHNFRLMMPEALRHSVAEGFKVIQIYADPEVALQLADDLDFARENRPLGDPPET